VNKTEVKIAIALLIITMVVSNAALVLFFNYQIDLLNQEISDLVKHRWRATEEMFSNETHTVVALKFFSENWTQIAEMNYLFYGNIEVSDTLEFVDVYASLYQIPDIESYKKVTPLEVKTIEDLANLIIPPFYLNTTNVEQRSVGNRSIYLVTAVNKFLFNFTACKWIPKRTVVFASVDASKAIQWAIDNGMGYVKISNLNVTLTKTINITRGHVIISGCNFTVANDTIPTVSLNPNSTNINILNHILNTTKYYGIILSKSYSAIMNNRVKGNFTLKFPNFTRNEREIRWRAEAKVLSYILHPAAMFAIIFLVAIITGHYVRKKIKEEPSK